jgi:hypothetical protein
MIKQHSDDPDVAAAAAHAESIIQGVLHQLPVAESFDYGGHYIKLSDYNMCPRCTSSIAESQQAEKALRERAAAEQDGTVREHIELAAELLHLEATAAIIRAEMHSGHGSEPIINALLAFIHERNIHDSYDHSHHQGS